MNYGVRYFAMPGSQAPRVERFEAFEEYKTRNQAEARVRALIREHKTEDGRVYLYEMVAKARPAALWQRLR